MQLITENDNTKGLVCDCGREERFGSYVYAHWYGHLTFTCPDCGRKYDLEEGEVEQRQQQAAESGE